MPVLVAYASKHGATQGIAERIAGALTAAGVDAEARPVKAAANLESYDAFVIGSAVYMFHWMKEAATFLRRHRELLVMRPVWLFSSGPLGTDETDAQGRDVREVAAAKETGELVETVKAREHHMFFGAFQPDKPIGLTERMVMLMPAARDAFPKGDFRDWGEIDRWAEGIARSLSAGA